MIIRLQNNVYAIKGVYYIYLLVIDNKNLLIIDSSNGEDIGIVLDGILEIKSKTNYNPSFLVLTSCKKEVAGGAAKISSFLNIPILASYIDASSIRKGVCLDEEYEPADVSIEIKDIKVLINGLNNLTFLRAKTPSKGSLIIKYNNALFSGATKISGIVEKIGYVCNAFEFSKVEEDWFLRTRKENEKALEYK
ncbi:hypothetical protein SUSAZ_03155 [Sulfolobus acidocaldarius SUSAZ]|nr:hypothetical protein SUSAZ_03155 [Sulfolobus acidocaldarius SUSAZ]